MGDPKPVYSDGNGRTQVLECECGEPGCWPLTVRIDIGSREVVWRDFHQPHRGAHSKRAEWRYDAMPQFRFERQSYEHALSASGRRAEPGASPNGGPARRAGNSEPSEGPPSVS